MESSIRDINKAFERANKQAKDLEEKYNEIMSNRLTNDMEKAFPIIAFSGGRACGKCQMQKSLLDKIKSLFKGKVDIEVPSVKDFPKLKGNHQDLMNYFLMCR